jgi:hypothetical protein
MSTIRTMLGTAESARHVRFEPVGAITATNVQQAIEQSNLLPTPIISTAVTFAMSPYTPTTSDTLLLVDTSGGSVTIAMPLAASRGGLDLEIKDDTGHAAANPISVTFAGSESADGLHPYPIEGNFASVKFGPQTGGYFIHA